MTAPDRTTQQPSPTAEERARAAAISADTVARYRRLHPRTSAADRCLDALVVVMIAAMIAVVVSLAAVVVSWSAGKVLT